MINSIFHRIIRIIEKLFKLYNLLLNNFQPSIKELIDVEQENSETLKNKNRKVFEENNSWPDFLENIEKEFSNSPATFLRSKYISKTIHPNEQEKATRLLNEMLGDPFSKKNILPFLSETPYGDPYLSEKFRFASPMTIQHVYYLFLIKKYLNIFLPTSNINSIVDFGGGYGNFCKLVHQFGYHGMYTIVDFDIMHKIQKKFISHNLPNLVYQNLNLKYVNSLSELNSSLDASNNIFIASYSLSETPKSVRNIFESSLHHFNYIFIIYQKYFDDFDNVDYFNSLEKKLKDKGDVKNIYSNKIKSYLFIYSKKNIKNKQIR